MACCVRIRPRTAPDEAREPDRADQDDPGGPGQDSRRHGERQQHGDSEHCNREELHLLDPTHALTLGRSCKRRGLCCGSAQHPPELEAELQRWVTERLIADLASMDARAV